MSDPGLALAIRGLRKSYGSRLALDGLDLTVPAGAVYGFLEALPIHFLRGWLAITETAGLGFAVATLARSQLAGIGVGIGLYFGETFAGLFLPEVVKYLPFHLATAAVGGRTGMSQMPSSLIPALSVDAALVLVTLWLIASLVLTAVFVERAEITG